MGMTWTDDQKKVIELRDRNILVSAAAGSGKTAVLVERIIKIITDKERPVDIDRLLIVTFTNAAAAEMRERIGNALENALKDQPDDEHLQRQLSLLHNAQITTIDSFCLYVIRNHFHEIDLEPNFRIGDEGELKLLKEDVLVKVLLKNYEVSTPEFLAFVDGYASGRNDAALSGMILQLYEFSRSYPWPKKWLLAAAEGYDTEDAASLESASFMQSFLQNLKLVTNDLVALAKRGYEGVGSDILKEAASIDAPYVQMDITDGEAVLKNIKEIKPDAVIHCAAWTAVDAAEDEDKQDKVYKINSEGTENIAKACKEIDVPMMYTSTDYVFDGQGESRGSLTVKIISL